MYWLALLVVPFFALAILPGVSASRRVLAGALVVLVPVAGLLLAMMVRGVRGGGVALEPVREEPRRRPSCADVARLGDLPPVLERLLVGDPAERLAALVSLSSVGDAAAMSVLRWTIQHGPAEVVLEAALTLEEIDLRGEVQVTATGRLPSTIEIEERRAAPEQEERRTVRLGKIASLVAAALV